MRVLFITDVYEKYGAYDSFIQMVESLKNNVDVNPIILTSKKKKIYNWALQNKFDCVYIKYCPFVFETRFSSKSLLWKLKKIINYIVYRTELFFALNQCRKKIDFSRIDIIHTNTNRIDIGACLSKEYSIPHVWHIREFGSSLDYNTYSLRKDYISFMNENSNSFIFISNAVKNFWINNGIAKDKSYVIWNGIINNINLKNDILTKDIYKLLMCGYVRESKGQHQLLEAVCNLPVDIKNKIRIDFYGDIDKEYYKKLKSIIKRGRLENQVVFKGFVANAKEYYTNYDIGFSCSKSEGLGRTTIDYMSFGCLVIASNTGANVELINHGENGFLYNYNDIYDLKEKLLMSINNVDQAKTVASKGYDFANLNFKTSDFSHKIFKVYQELLF